MSTALQQSSSLLQLGLKGDAEEAKAQAEGLAAGDPAAAASLAKQIGAGGADDAMVYNIEILVSACIDNSSPLRRLLADPSMNYRLPLVLEMS